MKSLGALKKITAAALLVGAGMFGLAQTASAVTYNVDELKCSLTLANSGDATELQAIADCIDGSGGIQGTDLNLGAKPQYSSLTIGIDAAGSYFVDVDPDTPGWFMLKFGNNSSGNNNYIFKNLADLTKLVWTSAQIGGIMESSCFTGGDCKLSHITYTGDTSVVPLPAAGLLLLGALGGLGFAARRRRKAA